MLYLTGTHKSTGFSINGTTGKWQVTKFCNIRNNLKNYNLTECVMNGTTEKIQVNGLCKERNYWKYER